LSIKLAAKAEDLREKFLTLRTARDVAELLEVSYGRLTYHIYKIPEQERYKTFEITKKSGGVRPISAPTTALKILQRKLNQVLSEAYTGKPSVHGFLRKRSILSNARAHLNRKFILNVDLKNFFPTINFGRVRGMFMGIPYKLPEKAATVLAQICCFNNELPQGAPTSPIVSNMICSKMDSELQKLAKKHRCYYTRYADDLTFSTSTQYFPEALARFDSSEKLQVGLELEKIIIENGFQINSKKIRLRTKSQRQEVTGLTVNEFPNVRRNYIRQIRAMLHAWEKFGLSAAGEEYIRKYDLKHRNPLQKKPSFEKVLLGKIQFLINVRGKSGEKGKIYRRFAKKLKSLLPDPKKLNLDFIEEDHVPKPFIITEGKSDWKHLKAALAKLKKQEQYLDLDIAFDEFDYDKGNDKLLKECQILSRRKNSKPQIHIFDRDDKSKMKEICDNDKNYKAWGNNVFSFAIPIPDHRKATPEISIEFYYKDSEITQKDIEGRRLFRREEFHSRSGRHIKEEGLICPDIKKIEKSFGIIDNNVYDTKDNNVALSKADFARYILDGVEKFSFDVSEFSKIFDIIQKIIEQSRKGDN